LLVERADALASAAVRSSTALPRRYLYRLGLQRPILAVLVPTVRGARALARGFRRATA